MPTIIHNDQICTNHYCHLDHSYLRIWCASLATRVRLQLVTSEIVRKEDSPT
jgi:hypothetical protein